MRFNCGPTWEERCKRMEQWHSWYAWYPVRLPDGQCVWLETVRRKGRCGRSQFGECWLWEYDYIKQE